MKTLLFALGAMALVGCAGMKPVGPFAKDVPITQQGQPLPNTPATASRAPAVKPTPPTLLVTPEEVNATNAHALASKLATELDTDMKSTVNAPVTVQVSRPKLK